MNTNQFAGIATTSQTVDIYIALLPRDDFKNKEFAAMIESKLQVELKNPNVVVLNNEMLTEPFKVYLEDSPNKQSQLDSISRFIRRIIDSEAENYIFIDDTPLSDEIIAIMKNIDRRINR